MSAVIAIAIAIALPGLRWAGYGWGEAARILAGAILGAGGLWLAMTLACAV
jgi:hypothetical protein